MVMQKPSISRITMALGLAVISYGVSRFLVIQHIYELASARQNMANVVRDLHSSINFSVYAFLSFLSLLLIVLPVILRMKRIALHQEDASRCCFDNDGKFHFRSMLRASIQVFFIFTGVLLFAAAHGWFITLQEAIIKAEECATPRLFAWAFGLKEGVGFLYFAIVCGLVLMLASLWIRGGCQHGIKTPEGKPSRHIRPTYLLLFILALLFVLMVLTFERI